MEEALHEQRNVNRDFMLINPVLTMNQIMAEEEMLEKMVKRRNNLLMTWPRIQVLISFSGLFPFVPLIITTENRMILTPFGRFVIARTNVTRKS
jgi:hypothetical protein